MRGFGIEDIMRFVSLILRNSPIVFSVCETPEAEMGQGMHSIRGSVQGDIDSQRPWMCISQSQ